MKCLRHDDDESCHLVLQLLLWDLDGVVLDAVAVPLVCHLLRHQLLEDEEQQLVVVSAEGQVAGERLTETDDSDSERLCLTHHRFIFSQQTEITFIDISQNLAHRLLNKQLLLSHRFMDI